MRRAGLRRRGDGGADDRGQPLRAPDPARAPKLTRAQAPAVLKHAGRRKITEQTDTVLAAPRSPQLGQPAAYAATVQSLAAVTATLNEQVASLKGQPEAHLGRHPDAETYPSQPSPAWARLPDGQRDRKCRSVRLEWTGPERLFQYRTADLAAVLQSSANSRRPGVAGTVRDG